MHLRKLLVPLLLSFFSLVCHAQDHSPSLGIFSEQTDIGNPPHEGAVEYDAKNKTYLVTGGGSNMWFGSDSFHFVWRKIPNDLFLSANISFVGTEGDPHRKACLIIRQGLDPDAPYADVALHGNGLTCLQYRETNGATTHEISEPITSPSRLRIEKRGQYVSVWVIGPEGEWQPAGGSVPVALKGPFYVGLGVCAHDSNAVRQAIFSDVKLRPLPPIEKPRLGCTLETINIASKDRHAVYFTTNHIEAPNWSRDGQYFLFNGKGHIYGIPVTGGKPLQLNTGFADHCNNDHGISPDGTQLAISDQSQEKHSLIYLLPINGGTPRRITANGPSYWHGWSPDGQTLAFCGERNKEFDVYTISVSGGEEKRLTTAPGLDDGPEFSPDGKYIYFNSERSGSMQIWRMKPDGSDQEQITNDEYNNWFPHISPNGHWLVFLTYARDVKGHPENKDVMLRIMPMGGGKTEVLAKLFGGQGTINVPSWSPDSNKLAFMSYMIIP